MRNGVALAAGILAAGTLVLCGIFWQEIELRYTVARLRSDRLFLVNVLEENPGEGVHRRALERFVETTEGKNALSAEFTTAVLRPFKFGDEGLLSLRKETAGREPDPLPNLEAGRAALLWIGPKTGGLMPAGENVAAHVLLVSFAERTGPAIGSGCVVASGDDLRLLKGIHAWIPMLLNHEFTLPALPVVRFRFIRGDDGTEGLGRMRWKETPPDASQVVCRMFRPEDGGRSVP